MPSDAPCRAPASSHGNPGSPGPLSLPARPREQLSRSGAPSDAEHCHGPRHARPAATCHGPGVWPPGPGYDALSRAARRRLQSEHSIHEHDHGSTQPCFHQRARAARARPARAIHPGRWPHGIAKDHPASQPGRPDQEPIGRADRGDPRPARPAGARDDEAIPAQRTPGIPCRHRADDRSERSRSEHRALDECAPKSAPHDSLASHVHVAAEGPLHTLPRERKHDPPHPGCLLSAASRRAR